MTLPLLVPVAVLQLLQAGAGTAVVESSSPQPPWLVAIVYIAPVVNTFFLYLMHKRSKRIESKVNATKTAAREAADELAHFPHPESPEK